MQKRQPTQKLIRLLALLVLLFLNLACSLTTAGSPSTVDMLANVNATATHNTQPAVPTITASPTRLVCWITAENLNLRTGPGVQYAVQASLPGGTALSPLSSPALAGWLLVKTDSQTGYVNSKFTNCQRK